MSLQEKEDLLNQTQQYLQQTKEKLNDFEQEKLKIESKLASQRELNNVLQTKNNELLADARLNRSTIKQQLESIDSISSENSDLKEKIQNQARINEEQINKLTRNLELLQNEKESLGNNNLSLEKKLSLSENKLKQLGETNKNLSDDLKKFELENNRLQNELSRVRT